MQFQQNPIIHGEADLLTANGTPNNATPINISGGQYFATNNLGIAALNQYEAILFYIQMANTTVSPIWATVSNPQHNSFSGAFAAGYNQGPPVGAPLGPSTSLVVGCGNSIGDQISVAIWFNGVPPANSLLWVYGLAQAPVGLRQRDDGRNIPIGALAAQGLAVGAMVAAPGTAHRLLVKSCNLLVNQAGVVGAGVTGTIGGSAINLCQAGCGNNMPTGIGEMVDPEGVLLDPNTAVNLNVTAAAAYLQGNIIYDIVPA